MNINRRRITIDRILVVTKLINYFRFSKSSLTSLSNRLQATIKTFIRAKNTDSQKLDLEFSHFISNFETKLTLINN